MHSQRRNPLPSILVLLILVSLACRVPESGTPMAVTQPTSQETTTAIIPTVPQATLATIPTSIIQATQRPATRPITAQHQIAIHSIYGLDELYNRSSSAHFIPRGVNYFLLIPVQDHYEDRVLAVGLYDHNRTQADFAALSGAGYNTVRIVVDGCTSGDSCIGRQDGQGLNPAYLDNLADLLGLAKANHLFVLLASQGLPEQGGYAALADQGANSFIDPGRNTTMLTPAGIQASQQYWSDIISGLAARKADLDIILGWELLAEQYFAADQLPFSMQSGWVTLASGREYDMARPSQRDALAVDGLRLYINSLKQTILTYDPTALVTMGFLGPDSPNSWREGDNRYVVTAPLLEDSALDFFDLHADPDSGISLGEMAQNFGLGEHITKPVIMGLVGASTWNYPEINAAAIAVQDWIAASCPAGFVGWVYAAYYPYPAGLPQAAWSFTDDHNRLLNALSPNNQPDACAVSVLPGRNLAQGKAVQVSGALPDQTAEMAVDGDPNTQWSAGGFPSQYVIIDLGAAYSIGEIRLTVGQWPDGTTMHQLWLGASLEEMQMVQAFSGHTYDFDELVYVPASTTQKYRYVKVITLESPAWVAWREIEVLAPLPATPTPISAPTLTPTP